MKPITFIEPVDNCIIMGFGVLDISAFCSYPNCVQKFNSEWVFEYTIGRTKGFGSNQFNKSRGMATDSSQNLYIAEICFINLIRDLENEIFFR